MTDVGIVLCASSQAGLKRQQGASYGHVTRDASRNRVACGCYPANYFALLLLLLFPLLLVRLKVAHPTRPCCSLKFSRLLSVWLLKEQLELLASSGFGGDESHESSLQPATEEDRGDEERLKRLLLGLLNHLVFNLPVLLPQVFPSLLTSSALK